MPKWEYRTIVVQRSIMGPQEYGFRLAGEWNFVVTDKVLNELGAEGWELVSVVPTSDLGGEISPKALATSQFDIAPGAGGPADYISYYGPMVSGLTTTVIFYFKRQRP